MLHKFTFDIHIDIGIASSLQYCQTGNRKGVSHVKVFQH